MKRFLDVVNRVLPYVLVLLLMWFFTATALSTSAARISALQTIEPYAFCCARAADAQFLPSRAPLSRPSIAATMMPGPGLVTGR